MCVCVCVCVCVCIHIYIWRKKIKRSTKRKLDEEFPGGLLVKNLLPMQETWARSHVWEDATGRGATKPSHHNHGARLPANLCSTAVRSPPATTKT